MANATPFVEDLALSARNNEAISEIFTLTNADGSPLDLTGRTFFAQARRGQNLEAELICDIDITIEGDAADGVIKVEVSDEVINSLTPVDGFWDLLTRDVGGPIDNLFMAPFTILGGASKWV